MISCNGLLGRFGWLRPLIGYLGIHDLATSAS